MSPDTGIIGPVWLSLQVALWSTLGVLPCALGLGWLLSRPGLRGKTFLGALVNIPLVLPPVVTGYALLCLLGPKSWAGQCLQSLGIEVLFTRQAAVLASAVVSLPLATWSIRTALEQVNPRIDDAARLLGKTEWQVFTQVSLPQARRGLASACVLAFARSLGEFGATLVIAGMTPGETLTIPGAVYLALQQPGQESQVAWLSLLALGLSLGSLLVVAWMQEAKTRPLPRRST